MQNPETPDDTKLPAAVVTTRATRIARIVDALSEMEKEELRLELTVEMLKEKSARFSPANFSKGIYLHLAMQLGLMFGISFGLIMSPFVLTFTGLQGIFHFLLIDLVAGLIFGTVMASAMVCMMSFVSSRKSLQFQSQLQKTDVEVALPAAEVFKIAESVLTLQRVRMEEIDESKGFLKGCSAVSWRSAGEVVACQIEATGADSTLVRVYSRPMLTILDFGKNKQNVESISKAIEERAEVHRILAAPI